MNLFLVEDDEDYADVLVAALRHLDVTVTIARSRDSALAQLPSVAADLIICDLKLPTTDDDIDLSTDHGDAVRAHVQEDLPGTPLVVHSAFGSIDYLADTLFAKPPTADAYGTGDAIPLISFVEKGDVSRIVTVVTSVIDQLRSLADIEIEPVEEVLLDDGEARALRVFARRRSGRLARVARLGGGLSGANVTRVVVYDGRGRKAAAVVAKLDTLPKIDAEYRAYDDCVAPLLPYRGFAPRVDRVCAGAGRKGGLFYSVDESYNRSLFDLLAADPDRAADVVGRLRLVTARWADGAPQSEPTVRDIRRLLVEDERAADAARVLGLDLEEFESRRLLVAECNQHRDLHGENILLDETANPVLIDYGDVGEGVSSLDPVTLELSVLFHPRGRGLRSEIGATWPDHDTARQWADVDRFAADSPFQAFVRACRDWAHNVSPSNRAVLASAYVYAIRQVNYEGVELDLVSGVIESIREAWQGV